MAPREAALVAREVGLSTARQMLLEAAVFSAPDLLQRGFLSRVVPDVDVSELTQASVQRICQLAPQAARLNKQTLRALLPEPSQALLTTAYDYADSAEQREGITAFLEKRPPAF
jgi:enoyl-CoA hydratase/carnithine racemase